MTRARADPSGIDSYPVSVSSEIVERKERRDPFSKATQNPKPNKNEDSEKERWDPFCSEIPEWLRGFGENLVDDSVPEHRDSHASSSREPSWEPTLTRSVDFGKHTVFILTSRKTEIARSVRGPNYKSPVQKTHWRSRTSCRKIWWLDNNRSRSSQWRLWISKNHRDAIVVQDLATPWIQSYPCKTKTSQETQRSLQKFLEPDGKPKVILHWQFLGIWQSLWKIFLGIIVRRHHTDRKQMRLLKEQFAVWKKVRLLYCCDQVWMKIGWQILWNVTPIFETSQISSLMGRRPMKDIFGRPVIGPIIPFGSLVEYYTMSAKDQSRIHQFGKKVFPGMSSDTLCMRGEFGRVTYWLQTLSWKRWRHLLLKTQMRKRWYFPKKNGKFKFTVADGRITISEGDQELRTPT